MKLVLIRHGESEWNKLNLFTGWTDVDLSEKGHEEAKAAGRLLKQVPPPCPLSPPIRRANSRRTSSTSN